MLLLLTESAPIATLLFELVNAVGSDHSATVGIDSGGSVAQRAFPFQISKFPTLDGPVGDVIGRILAVDWVDDAGSPLNNPFRLIVPELLGHIPTGAIIGLLLSWAFGQVVAWQRERARDIVGAVSVPRYLSRQEAAGSRSRSRSKYD